MRVKTLKNRKKVNYIHKKYTQMKNKIKRNVINSNAKKIKLGRNMLKSLFMSPQKQYLKSVSCMLA